MNVAAAVAPSPSVTFASLTDTAGNGSSSVIVPIACGSAMVEFVAFERSTRYVSFTSSSESPFTSTVSVRLVWPGLNVSVEGGTAA